MAANRDPNRMFNLLKDMQDLMERLIESAQNLAEIASEFGGEINRVVFEQITEYYIPSLRNLIDDAKTPGSLIGISKFLDSLPLAMARSKRDYTEDIADVVKETSEVLEDAKEDIERPEGSTVSDRKETAEEFSGEIPAGTSYANPVEGATPEAPGTPEAKPVEIQEPATKEAVHESLERPSKYFVVRNSKKFSPMAGVRKDHIVAECDSEEDAQDKCDYLNEMISPAERDFLGTEYSVKKR